MPRRKRAAKALQKPAIVLEDDKVKPICAAGECRVCTEYQQPHSLCYLVVLNKGIVGMICSNCYERSTTKRR